MIQDWQSGKRDAEWNPGEAVPHFVVDLSGTRPLPLLSTLSLIRICGKGCDELTRLRLNSGTWTQEACSQNCHTILEYFGCRNWDDAVSLSTWCCGIFQSCCANQPIYMALYVYMYVYIYGIILLDWWSAIGCFWPCSLLPWCLASTVVHMNNDPGEECNKTIYTWRGEPFHIVFLLCLVVFRGYKLWQGPNTK